MAKQPTEPGNPLTRQERIRTLLLGVITFAAAAYTLQLFQTIHKTPVRSQHGSTHSRTK